MNVQGFFNGILGVEAGGYPLALVLVILSLIFFKKYRPFTKRLLTAMNIFTLVCASISFVVLIKEIIPAWYNANPYEQGAFQWRIAGPYWWSYWIMMASTFIIPQLFWFKKLRTNIFISILCVLPLMFERFVIIMMSMYRDYRPGAWSYYEPHYGEFIFAFGLYAICISLVYCLLFLVKRKHTTTS